MLVIHMEAKTKESPRLEQIEACWMEIALQFHSLFLRDFNAWV